MLNRKLNSDDFFINDFTKNRMIIENTRMVKHYPQFRYSEENRTITGRIRSRDGVIYEVEINWTDKYPYVMPDILLKNHMIDSLCRYQYEGNNRPCTIHRQDWHETLSLLYLLYRTEVWINKYEHWKQNKSDGWPGKGQHKE